MAAAAAAGGVGRRIGAGEAAAIHFVCFLGLASVYAAGFTVLTPEPAATLQLLVIVETPIVVGLYSRLRRDRSHCSLWKAIGRGLIGLPVGALLNAFGAIVLGAPVSVKYWSVTAYWSILMSLFTFVPAACVLGASRIDWLNVMSCSRPTHAADYTISAPGYGAIIGAWLGAWLMPLDWDRPWQEWPICVTYGAICGYLIGSSMSIILVFLHNRRVHSKGD